MSKRGQNQENPVFTLAFAHYHGPWEWTYVQELLRERGVDSIAPDLPIEDPDAKLDDHASIIREAEERYGAEKYVNVGHSWGGDLIYRKLGSTPVSKLIFLAAPLRPALKNVDIPEGSLLGKPRSLLYHSFLAAEESGKAEFDSQMLGHAFYNELSDRVLKALAIGQLRQHPHVPEDSAATLPEDMDMHYIWLARDNAFLPAAQLETAMTLGIECSFLRTDHFPMLSNPEVLVKRLMEIIKKDDRETD